MPDVKVMACFMQVDETTHELIAQLGPEALVWSGSAFVASTHRQSALLEMLSLSTRVIVVLPPGNRVAPNLVFAAGAALGASKPVLVVGDERPPQYLEGLAFMSRRAVDQMRPGELLRYMELLPPMKRTGPSAAARTIDMSPQVAMRRDAAPISDLFQPQQVLDTIRDLFKGSHVQTVSSTKGVDFPADLVIWDDRLTAYLSQPMLVQVGDQSGSPVSLVRLREALKSSGSKSLIYVSSKRSLKPLRHFEEGMIISVSAKQLLADVLSNGLVPTFSKLTKDA
jgi:hypothetical protein